MAYLVAIVVVAIGLTIAAVTRVSQPDATALHSANGPERNPQSVIPNRSPNKTVVGRITGMVDCTWGQGTGDEGQGAEILKSEIRNLNSVVALGNRYVLRSGLLELTYDTGAKVILQGPVTYEVDSTDGGYLAVGKLTGKVENETAKGFAVRTPTATVTDLGTEFGVEVSSDGATDTQVFVGKVQIVTEGIHRNSGKQPRVLQAGEYAHVGKDLTLSMSHGTSTDKQDFNVRAERFARTMPSQLDAGDAYAKLVLSMDPVVYYRMDRWPMTGKTGQYVLVDSAPGGCNGLVVTDQAFGKPTSRGRFGGAIDFHGSEVDEFAVVRSYPKTQSGQLSVSVWVWPVSLAPWGTIVCNWYHAPNREEIGQFGIGIGGSGELLVQLRQQNGQPAKVGAYRSPLSLCQWHHVAMVADGKVLHVYQDGVEVGSSPYRGIAHDLAPMCLDIGCAMEKDGSRPRFENAFRWNGRLDEAAVFNRALSPLQVQQLFTGQAVCEGRRTSP